MFTNDSRPMTVFESDIIDKQEHIPLALNLDIASAPGAAFIRPLLALLAEPIRPICKLDAEPIAGGGVRDPEARPKGL